MRTDRLRRRNNRNNIVTDHTDLRFNLTATAAISNSLQSLCGRTFNSQMWETGFTVQLHWFVFNALVIFIQNIL